MQPNIQNNQELNDEEGQEGAPGDNAPNDNAPNDNAPKLNDLWPEDVKDDADDADDEKKEDKNKSDISIRIAPATINDNIHNIVLELSAKESGRRLGVDICAVLDTSGSMCSSAAVADEDGSVSKDDGLSLLDCVKHSVKTVISCLSDTDRFSMVSFSCKGKLEYKLNYMNDNGKQTAINALEKLEPNGQTNLWDGLLTGLDSLRNDVNNNGRLSVIMLLTDGVPTIIPPNGHVHELTNYIDKYNLCQSIQINTFGFGYELDSDLLHSLAVHGNGTFAFIPDSKIVGTCFVNSICNVLTTLNVETKLHLIPMNGAKFVGKSYGDYKEQDESWGRVINIGPIMSGSKRYISIPMTIKSGPSNGSYLECHVKMNNNDNKKIIGYGIDGNVSNQLLAGHLTSKTVSIGFEALNLSIKQKGNAALKIIGSLKEEILKETNICKNKNVYDYDEMTANSRLEALNGDVNGRFNKAFQGEVRFNRWGKHYLRALLRAHQLNICTNFMDPGLQVNGGESFKKLRAKGDEIFINLPPPKPSRRVNNNSMYYNTNNKNNNNNNNNNQAAPQAQPQPQPQPEVNMADYYGGSGGGCFAPYCTVNVLNIFENNRKGYITKNVCDVQPGDMVSVCDGGLAKVVYVVKLARNKQKRMIKFPESGLVITGGHPIRRNKLWCLPREQNDIQFTVGCDYVYTFVLDTTHILMVNGVECITWGHGLKDNVVNHGFYGGNQVINALKEKAMDMNVKNVSMHHMLDNVIAIYQ